MSCKSILPLFLLTACWGLGQSTAPSFSNKEVLRGLESSVPVSQPTPIQEANPPTTATPTPQPNHKPDSSLATIANSGVEAHVAPATVLSNNELLLRGKTIYVETDSFFVKKEQLERGLVNRKELGEWGIHVVNSPFQADLVLKVRRAPFQNNFPFTFTDRVSGIVVMGGTVNSLFGTVPGKIAARLAEKLQEIKEEEQKKRKPSS